MKKLLLASSLLSLLGAAAHAQTSPAFRAGAAKVDITPDAAVLRPGDSIRDPLYVRAIVVGNGASCAVLVGLDQAGLRGGRA